MLRIWITIILMAVLSGFSAAAKSQLTLYIYHLKPPYVIDLEKRQGLYFDIAKLLNESLDAAEVRVRFVPRKRINRLIAAGKLDGMVLGVNPNWFGDPQKQKYLWSSPIMYDTDEFVSHVDQAFEYIHPVSLYGNQVGVISGYYYRHLEAGVKANKVERVDVNSEQALLEMVMKKRVTLAIVSRSTVEYLVAKNAWPEVFYFSQLPHETYYRAIMAPHSERQNFKMLEDLLSDNAFQAKLVTLLKSYHLVY